MAVTVVLDHPRQHLALRMWRRIGALSGGIVLTVGLLASVVAFPTTILVASFVFGWLSDQEGEVDPWPSEDVPVPEILLAWGVSSPIAIVALKLGLRLLRGDRELVLFLRRFGFDDATRAVTYAASKTIGGAWRLVTLDDAEIAPIGVARGTATLFGAGRFIARATGKVGQAFMRLFPFAVLLMWAIVGLEFLRAEDWRKVLDDGTLDPYFDTLQAVAQLRFPFDAIGGDLPGLFALVVIAAALAAIACAVGAVAILLGLLFLPILLFVWSSADAVREAEAAKTSNIRTVIDADVAAATIAARSRKVFAPRLVVIRVATPVWQETVSRLADVSAVSLIDLSDPTENVLWELEELTRRFGPRCLIVGQRERVARFADPAETAAPGSLDERLRALLDGQEVLAYTTDRRGMRRFARALRGKLLTVSG